MLDKDDDEEQDQEQPDDEDLDLDEEKMLDIAEHCFVRIAETLLDKNLSIR